MLIFHGMLRSANFGDVLMAQICLSWLREMTDEPVHAMCVTSELRDLLDLPQASFYDLLQSKATVLSGGGYFQIADNGLPPLKRMIKNAGPLLAAQLIGRPTAVIGAGVGPVPPGVLGACVRYLFSKAEISCVRDRVGVETVKRLSPRANVLQSSDLVFTLNLGNVPPAANKIANQLVGLQNGYNRVGILFSNIPDHDERYGCIFKSIISAANHFPDTHFFLLEDHAAPGSGQQNCQSMLNEHLGPKRSTILPYPGTFELTAILGRMDSVLTDKLHVGLVAAAMGVTPYSIAKHPKNLAAYADIGLIKNCIFIDNAQEGQINDITLRACGANKPLSVPKEIRQGATNNKECLRKFLQNNRLLSKNYLPYRAAYEVGL